MRRTLLLVTLAFSVSWLIAVAQQPNVEVEHADPQLPKKSTLRFLRENRDFLRAQLDRLRQTERKQDGDARELSARDLFLRDLLARIEASEDSLLREQALLAQREFLASVSELGELEQQLDELEALLIAQRARLGELEGDYLERQQTALMLILEGAPQGEVPDTWIVREPGDRTWRVSLNEAQKQALREGGAAQLLHEFVEPRTMHLTLVAEGEAFADWPAWQLEVAPARDRLTLVRLDFSQPKSGQPLPMDVWQR
jgi:hypothetical protein